MVDLRALLQQALEALRGYRREMSCHQPCDAEVALEAALEQPEPEPVATVTVMGSYNGVSVLGCLINASATHVKRGDRLYTHPPRREWCSLSEEEIESLECDLSADRAYENYTGQEYLVVNGASDFARAIEDKLKEKNHD